MVPLSWGCLRRAYRGPATSGVLNIGEATRLSLSATASMGERVHYTWISRYGRSVVMNAFEMGADRRKNALFRRLPPSRGK